MAVAAPQVTTVSVLRLPGVFPRRGELLCVTPRGRLHQPDGGAVEQPIYVLPGEGGFHRGVEDAAKWMF